AEHEWVRRDGDDLVVGITDYAQDSLGDIVFVSLPDAETPVSSGQACGEVESTKSVSDIFAPLAGIVLARNDVLDSAPETINSDPYGEGWLFRLRPEDPAAFDDLLDAAGYQAHIEG
ncbi:MAG: glycine cleavage system protein GcvH, partial [Actinomycetales bacterium]